MITFDGKTLAASLKRKKTLNRASIVFFGIIFIEALIVAVLSRNAESDWGLYIALYVQIAVFVVLYVFYLIFFVRKEGKRVKYGVCKAIADGLLSRQDFLGGEKNISFKVDYQGDTLTVTRQDFAGEITINPSRVSGLTALSGRGQVEFDLRGLKILPSVYSDLGTHVWAFLQAYYCTGARLGQFDRVSVCDLTGKTPLDMLLIDDGKPVKDCADNYFIVKGLVK